MESFCRTKKKMFLPIWNGITDALPVLEHLNERMKVEIPKKVVLDSC